MAPTTRSKLKRQERELEAELLRRCANNVTGFDRVRELVEVERVNVNCADGRGCTPLILVVRYNRELRARLLLENNADANAVGKDGWNALSVAVLKGNVAMAQLLLESDANVESIAPIPNWGKCSLLGFAILKHNVGMVRLFLRFGANTEETLFNGETCTAIYLACWLNFENNVEIVQLLLDHDDGVDINSVVPRDHYHRGDPAMSPLCHACQRGNMEMVQLLVQHGARVIFDGVYPHVPCPLVEAVPRRRSLELVRFLLNHSRFSEPVDRNARLPQHEIMGEQDTAGTHHPLSPPLDMAIEYNQPQVAQLLVDRGANVNDKPFLWQCAKFQHQPRLEIARLLVRAGANVNLADGESGETPLWAAAEKGNVELVKMLLKARADVRIRDVNGETPLGVAYRRGHKDIVYLLLRTSPHVWPKLRSFVSGVSH